MFVSSQVDTRTDRLDYKKHGHREICEALKKDRLASAGTLTSAIPINSTNELNQDVIRDWALQQRKYTSLLVSSSSKARLYSA